MTIDTPEPEREPERKPRPRKNNVVFLLISIALFVLLIAYELYKPVITPVKGETPVASTPTPLGSPTCPINMQLATPVGVDPSTRLIVILYDPWSEVIPGLDLTNGERITDIPLFISKLIPDILGPGDEVSVFQLGYDTYTAARVTRQYSYLTIYPQLYVPPTLSTLTPLPPTGVPTAGFGEVATKNAFRAVSTERAIAEAVNLANYNCAVSYYNENIQSTATAWQQSKDSDISGISTAAVSDFALATPSRRIASEMRFGGLYYGLYYASVDIKADCAKYDVCDLIIIDDLHYYNKHNIDHFPIDLTGVNVYSIMPDCRDINQPDCSALQSFWTTEFQSYGASKIVFWNGIRAEINLLDEIGR